MLGRFTVGFVADNNIFYQNFLKLEWYFISSRVTGGATEKDMEVFTSSFAYNFVRK